LKRLTPADLDDTLRTEEKRADVGGAKSSSTVYEDAPTLNPVDVGKPGNSTARRRWSNPQIRPHPTPSSEGVPVLCHLTEGIADAIGPLLRRGSRL
jgi:hypothetical protein